LISTASTHLCLLRERKEENPPHNRFSKLSRNKALSNTLTPKLALMWATGSIPNCLQRSLPTYTFPTVKINSKVWLLLKNPSPAQVSTLHGKNVVHHWHRVAFIPLHSFKSPTAGLEVCQNNKELFRQILLTFKLKQKE